MLLLLLLLSFITPRRQQIDTYKDIKTIKHKKDKLLVLKNIKCKTRKKKYKYSLQNIKCHRKSNGKIFEYRMFYRVSSIVRAQNIFRA